MKNEEQARALAKAAKVARAKGDHEGARAMANAAATLLGKGPIR